MTHTLHGLRVAVLATDGVEQIELTEPVKALEKAGAIVEIISLRPGHIQGVNHLTPGKKIKVDRTLKDVTTDQYDALLLPGGAVNPDTLRQDQRALDFVRVFDAAQKPMAIICHAPWLLASAGIARGRRLTSWEGIKDDMINAGAQWEDAAVVKDENWVSSRNPADLPKFNKAMIELFAERSPRVLPEPPRSGGVWRWLLGGALTAASGYALKRYLSEASDVASGTPQSNPS